MKTLLVANLLGDDGKQIPQGPTAKIESYTINIYLSPIRLIISIV